MNPLQAQRIAAKVLIVDDEPANVRLLERMLAHAGCEEPISTTDPREAMDLCETHTPDAVLLDLNMPHLDGLTLLGLLTERYPCRLSLPILVLTADATSATKHRALQAGATDFLTKPLDALELVLRLGNHLQSRSLHLALTESNERLESRVRERTRDLERAQSEIIERLAVATEQRDDDTGDHVRRVAELTGRIAREMGTSADEVEILCDAVRLHDIGKISVPDAILHKPGPLTSEEYAIMRKHTIFGGKILEGSGFPIIVRAEEIARHHHERWDGAGYPEGLMGETIPLSARIAAVADVFDALTHARPYKRAWCSGVAVDEIVRQMGTHFDPRVVDAFVRIVDSERLSRTIQPGCREHCSCRSQEAQRVAQSRPPSPLLERTPTPLERIVEVLKAA